MIPNGDRPDGLDASWRWHTSSPQPPVGPEHALRTPGRTHKYAPFNSQGTLTVFLNHRAYPSPSFPLRRLNSVGMTSESSMNYVTTSSSPMSSSYFSDLIPEVLCQIFEYYTFHDATCASFGSTGSPLTLSWVNSHWRRVALHTPELWSGLRFVPRRDTGSSRLDICHVALLADLWLSRSGNRKLQLGFSHNVKGRVELGQALLDVICSYSTRWEDVDFFGCTFRPELVLPLKPGDLPSLKTYRIQEISVYSKDLKPQLREVLCSAANLQSLRFKGSISLWLENLGPQITQLSLMDIFASSHPVVVHRVLQSLAGSLEVLSLNVSSWTPQWTVIRDPVPLVLPKLRTLSLHTDGSAAPFFDMAILPVLEEFEFYHDYSPSNAPSFVSLFRRSKCPLKTLSLRNSQISADLMRECVELINGSLTALHLHRAKCISASELCTILSPNAGCAYARHLRRLSFTEPRTLDEPRRNKTFLDVLLERMRGAAEKDQPKLKYLHACVNGEEMKQLRDLVDTFEDDMELKVGCSRRSVCVCLQD